MLGRSRCQLSVFFAWQVHGAFLGGGDLMCLDMDLSGCCGVPGLVRVPLLGKCADPGLASVVLPFWAAWFLWACFYLALACLCVLVSSFTVVDPTGPSSFLWGFCRWQLLVGGNTL